MKAEVETVVGTVKVETWWRSKEILLNIASVATAVGTLALTNLSMLGLAPATAFYVMVVLTLVVNVSNIVLRRLSNSIVDSKPVVVEAKHVEAAQKADAGVEVR